MPLRRGSNGGWQRVSSKTEKQESLNHDEESSDASDPTPVVVDVVAPSIDDDDNNNNNNSDVKKKSSVVQVTCGIDVYKSPGKMEISDSSSWTMEGIRRVRADRVMRRMRFVTAMAALGGFLFGYDTGVISGAMLPIQRAFSLSPAQEEVIVSSTILAAFLSSLVGGSLNHRFGRRWSILLAASTFTVGAFMLMLAWNYWTLVVGRIVVGIGIGIASLTTPIYLAEVAVPSVRGQLVTINAFLVTVGQFSAGMVDGAFDMVLPSSGWRYMLGLAAVPSITMFIGFLSLPESPRWLASKGRNDEALQVLKYLRESDQEAQDELAEILGALPSKTEETDDVDEEDNNDPPLEYGSGRTSVLASKELDQQENNSSRFFEMIAHGPTRRALLVGCGIMLVQQCSGVNTVMYYAATIYRMSQFDETTSVWLSGFTALAQVIGIGLSIVLVERVGRRKLVLTSLALITISLVGMGGTFYLARITSQPVVKSFNSCGVQDATIWDGKTRYCYDCASIAGCGFCGGVCGAGNSTHAFQPNTCPNNAEWFYDTCSNPIGWLSVFFMVAYLLTFGIGMGGMPWTINSEIYPLRFRSTAVSLSTATNWIGNLIISATFLSLSSPSALTAYGAFWLYALVAFFGYVFLYCSLPETKGLSLEEIEKLFHRAGDGYGAVEQTEDPDHTS